MENQAILLKEAILSNLNSAKGLDKFLVKTDKLRRDLADKKKNDPNLTVSDVESEIEELFEMNQKASLLVKDIDSLSNRIVGLKMASDLLNLELELTEEDAKTLDMIRSGSEIFFYAESGNLIPTDDALISKFMDQTKERHFTEETKEIIFKSL